MASVASQTLVKEIEQLVIPDHVGVGVDGMYASVPRHKHSIYGDYVMFLCDDDVFADDTVVEQVKAYAVENSNPPLILVATQKGENIWPAGNPWPPRMGAIDLNCAIVRADVWKQHVASYGHAYEGDYIFLKSLYNAGIPAAWCNLLVSRGAVSRGAAEAA